jgi:co-chaperonin GroES (HSP10)
MSELKKSEQPKRAVSAVDFEPSRDFILLKLPENKSKTDNGVYIPENLRDRSYPMYAKVVATGPNANELSLEDIVYLPLKDAQGNGRYVPIDIDNTEYGLVSKINIYGVLKGKEKENINKKYFLK